MVLSHFATLTVGNISLCSVFNLRNFIATSSTSAKTNKPQTQHN